MTDRYVNPATGNDSNGGTSEVDAWASLGSAFSQAKADGNVSRVLIYPTAPFTITSANDVQIDFASQGIELTTATDDLVDVRGWTALDGSTAVKYDDRYHGGTPTQPDLWVFVGTRTSSCLSEYLGGEGDDLVEMHHIFALGTSSATYNNATNLSRLSANPWTFWTGSDGTDTVTIFNPNGSPAGRTWAQSCPGINALDIRGLDVTINGFLMGGTTGCTNTGVGVPGYPITVSNNDVGASGGVTIQNSRIYAGGTHHLFLGSGENSVIDCELGRTPGWVTGSYSACVSYLGGIGLTANQHVYRRVYSLRGGFGVRGTQTGRLASFKNTSMLTDYFSHGEGDLAAVLIDHCQLMGKVSQGSDGGNMSPDVTVQDSEVGTVDGGTGGTYVVNRCKLTHVVPQVNGAVTFSDCIIQPRSADFIENVIPRFEGATHTYRRCTFLPPTGTISPRCIWSRFSGTNSITFDSCAFNLVGNGGSWNLMRSMTATDSLTSNYNRYQTSSSAHVILLSHNDGSTTANRTFTQMQAMGLEANGGETTDLKLDATGYPAADSPVIDAGNSFANTNDYTGRVFATRNDAGAYEFYIPPESSFGSRFVGGLTGGSLTDTGRLLPSRVVG